MPLHASHLPVTAERAPQRPSLDNGADYPSEHTARFAGLQSAGGGLGLNRELADVLAGTPEIADGIRGQIRSLNSLQRLGQRMFEQVVKKNLDVKEAEAKTPKYLARLQSALGDNIPITDAARARNELKAARLELHDCLKIQHSQMRSLHRRIDNFLEKHDPVTQKLAPWRETLEKLQYAPAGASVDVFGQIEKDLRASPHGAIERFLAEVSTISRRTLGTVGEPIKHLAEQLDRSLTERARMALELCGFLGKDETRRI